MATFKRGVALTLALILCFCFAMTTLTSCTGGKNGDKTTTTTTTNPNNDPTQGTQKAYTVSIKTIGGRPLSGLTFYVYKGENDLITYGTTDANGIGTVNRPEANGYYVVVAAGTLTGYIVEEKYPFEGNSANIVLSSKVIEDTNLDNVSYKVATTAPTAPAESGIDSVEALYR